MTEVDVLQTALTAEHAAVYLYAALGARTSESRTPVLWAAVSAAYAEHRAWRDRLTARIRDLGAEPVSSAATYVLPAGVARPALALERGCAETYDYVVAGTTGADRSWAVTALTRSAVRQVAFGGTPDPLPGRSGPT